jgi:hypothetical protein
MTRPCGRKQTPRCCVRCGWCRGRQTSHRLAKRAGCRGCRCPQRCCCLPGVARARSGGCAALGGEVVRGPLGHPFAFCLPAALVGRCGSRTGQSRHSGSSGQRSRCPLLGAAAVGVGQPVMVLSAGWERGRLQRHSAVDGLFEPHAAGQGVKHRWLRPGLVVEVDAGWARAACCPAGSGRRWLAAAACGSIPLRPPAAVGGDAPVGGQGHQLRVAIQCAGHVASCSAATFSR